MNLIFLRLTMLFVSIYSYAQTTYNGQIFNEQNQPVSGATIQSIEENKGVMSDLQGNFNINLNNNKVKISYIGYKTQTVNLTKGTNKITLVIDQNALEEIVISASREQQKRSEVPAAISVISSQKIKETKPFGIDQLVNDVPGVYMSTSRSNSNEQHFTAIRSPISTKPLFLFLEDGLPIRPTAIFNHNALLEMNLVAHERIEVLRGPNASIYGSDAIGGSFNFITKNPTKKLTGHVGFQANELGYSSISFDAGKQITDHFGIYIGSQFNQRNNGPFEHSDYDKFALTVKTVFQPFENSRFTLAYNGIDFFTDMAGSISEPNYRSQNFESDQTFTNRDAVSSRIRATWDQKWNVNNKTSLNLAFRDNVMKQNPSFRISPERVRGTPTGRILGEVNNNSFQSYFGNLQHQLKIPSIQSSLILGGSVDMTEQDYVANRTLVTQDETTRKNTDFEVLEDDFILNYKADILNYAAYTQFEFSPIEQLKLTGGLRYDRFEYDFTNRKTDEDALEDRKDTWDNLAPKIGANFNFTNRIGLYANYSQGFTPPQASTLYRNRDENENLKPSRYDNFEIGSYFNINKKIRLDLALYELVGKNTLVTVRSDDGDDAFISTNAGETRSYGIEYGVVYNPIPQITISHNGSYAKHKYEKFTTVISRRGSGELGDFSDTDRETAPNLIGTSKIRVTPGNGLSFGFEHELIGKYNTSFEDFVRDEDGNRTQTATYSGHNVFNFQASYQYKKIEFWMHLLNMFDKLYSNRASYNLFRNQNSYTVGNPRTFHVGVKYNF